MQINLLPLETAISTIDQFKANFADTVRNSAKKTPPIVFQYWDKNPPEQINTLLDRNKKLCAKHKIKHVVMNDAMARDFIKQHFSEEVYRAYDVSPHPAMQCDLLRLCYLYQEGGLYLDADMGFTEEFAELFALAGELVVFKWDTENRITVLNGVIGSVPRSAIIEYILNVAVQSILAACQVNPANAIKGILGISGPVMFTRAIGSFIQQQNNIENAVMPEIHVERVHNMFRWVRNGPDFLKKPLAYKSTELHWLVAAKK